MLSSVTAVPQDIRLEVGALFETNPDSKYSFAMLSSGTSLPPQIRLKVVQVSENHPA
jgi:hypothetical protein